MKYSALIVTLAAVMAAVTVAITPAPAAADDTEEALWTILGVGTAGLITWEWYSHASPDERALVDDLIKQGAGHLWRWTVAAGDAVLLDGNVRERLLAGDYEGAATLALPIFACTMKNEATAELATIADPDAALLAAWEVIQQDELLAAMISRPGGQGLWWRYLAWRTAHGYEVTAEAVMLEWPSGEDLHDLLHLLVPVVIEEYQSATEYLAAAIRNQDDVLPISAEPEGIDTGAEDL